MCYGFETKIEAAILIRKLLEKKYNVEAKELDESFKKINIRPNDKILCVYKEGNKLQISLIKWGIKFGKDKPNIVNSRSETIKEKKFWNDLFTNNRCLVPMTSFYEWIEVDGKKVQHKIYIYNEEYFFVPGIMYKDKDNNLSVSIITTTPNKFIEPFHNRMPVLLELDEALQFIDESAIESLKRLRPYPHSIKMRKEVAVLPIRKKKVSEVKKD
ncbi:SOS response-associated peptidase [Melioribacter sp. OK-6-Me]|uniref:SOS response-associated peptidase n=1 Tax=unclassified Melioribacter TaxID=2627329 RepID=UPI003EDA3E79